VTERWVGSETLILRRLDRHQRNAPVRVDVDSPSVALCQRTDPKTGFSCDRRRSRSAGQSASGMSRINTRVRNATSSSVSAYGSPAISSYSIAAFVARPPRTGGTSPRTAGQSSATSMKTSEFTAHPPPTRQNRRRSISQRASAPTRPLTVRCAGRLRLIGGCGPAREEVERLLGLRAGLGGVDSDREAGIGGELHRLVGEGEVADERVV
jgi:hypothetical protein